MTFPILKESAFSAAQVQRLTELAGRSIPDDLTLEQINSYALLSTMLKYGEEGRRYAEQTLDIFRDSPCYEMAKAILGPDIRFLVPHCTFRYHEPGVFHSHQPFHFDANFLGTDSTMLNFWIPLVDVGLKAPGLTFLKPEVDAEILLKSWLEAIYVAKAKGIDFLRVNKRYTAEDIGKLYGTRPSDVLFSPVLSAGSVALFHHLTLHATQPLPNGGDYRLSLEIRVAAASALPQVYHDNGYCTARAVEGGGGGYEYDFPPWLVDEVPVATGH